MSEDSNFNPTPLGSSFRDPSGFLFSYQGGIYRQVNQSYREHYDVLMKSGLYDALIENELLVPHQDVSLPIYRPGHLYKILKPELINFISYPYEWSFSQLKDASLITLNIQKLALDYGMSLKDSSAFNVQFYRGKPILIDTLSFEIYPAGKPWVAYRQFCQHFLAPLSLMAYKDIRIGQILKNYIDGIPLDFTSKLLPWQTRFQIPLFFHIHLHASSQKRFGVQEIKSSRPFNETALRGLIDSLYSGINHLHWKPIGTEWADYYSQTNYTNHALEKKVELINIYLDQIRPKNLWDLGANLGYFSRLASDRGIFTIAFDLDPSAVELNYLETKSKSETNLLPLIMDLANPTPNIGWENNERLSFTDRGPADAIMALALIHHLVISNNVPLNKLSILLHKLSRWLILEFVPKHDSQVQRLLANREDIFEDYTQNMFEIIFSQHFRIHRKDAISESDRVLYLMESH